MWSKLFFWRKKPVEPVLRLGVVQAVGTSGRARGTSADIEKVMSWATKQAAVDGITDPVVVRERKMAARAAYKAVVKQVEETGEAATFVVGDKSMAVRCLR